MDGKNEVVELNLNDIIPNRFQPREIFDERALKELAVSIKEHGVIQPIIVRNVNGKYEIIAGERRYKASALAGLTKIPAIVRYLDDKESSKVALLENLQRKNLNPIEEARTYQKILEIDQMTQEQLAKTMGKSQSAVANKIRLLSLSDEIQEALLKEKISERHARTLLNIKDEEQQKEMLKKIIDTKMSVRALEEEIKKIKLGGEEEKESIQSEEETESIEKVSMMDNYLNDKPLNPTAEMPDDMDNFGKVTFAPPKSEDETNEEPPMNKFINFGEIDKEEEEQENNMIPTIEETKPEKKDIQVNNSSADLDNLLNLNSTTSINNDEYMSEAEKIVKTDSSMPSEKIEDYFDTPDFNSMPHIQTNDPQEQNNEHEALSVDEGINKIKDLTKELKERGLKVSADEMDFESSYQVIIKIDKE